MPADQPGLFEHGTASAMHGRGAVLSADGVYRYRLWRIWDRDRHPTAFVMLNPSTADADLDDPTIRRCVGFARSWGAGGIVVVNLFAFRATDPADLARSGAGGVDLAGADRDLHLQEVFGVVDSVVCAWGACPVVRSEHVRAVLSLIPASVEVTCLGRTKEGHPRHPLYLAASTARTAFRKSVLQTGGGDHG